MFGLITALLWGYEAAAQPINYGIKNTSTQRPVRAKDKHEYTEEAEARWALLKVGFEKRTREKDPFGSKMDPGIFKPPAIPLKNLLENKSAEPVKVIPFQDVVDKFKPNLISATQQELMIGSRILQVGDPVQILHEGVLFKLRITKITPNEVELINTETGEKASVREYEFDPADMEGDDSDFLKKNAIKEKAPLLIK